MKRLLTLLFAVTLALPALAKEEIKYPEINWPQDGMLGTYDRGSLQRGYQVYKQVCSACHAMKQMSYRNLSDLGYTEDQIKTLAAEVTVQDGPDDSGNMFDRPGRPSDHFKAPFANEKAARAANGGAYPKDLSLMVKAREGHADYVHALLIGFEDPPAGFKVPTGMYYNKYFEGHLIGMPSPLSADGLVSYAGGTVATKDQMAKDVTEFLSWASEPELEARKKMGLQVLIFLGVFAVVMYFAKKQVWKGVKH